MEQRQEPRQRLEMLAIFAQHMRDASVGAEVFSFATLIGLAVAQLIGRANQNSIIFQVLAGKYPGLWITALLIVGIGHFVCFWRPAIIPWITLRKLFSTFGFAVWTGLVYDLIQRDSWSGVILITPCMALLFYAVCRVRYTV